MSELVPVYQPEGSNLCGQACVATILGISLDEATKLVGKGGLTGTRHIRAALAKRGHTLGPRIPGITVHTRGDTTYLGRVHWTKKPEPGRKSKRTHWIVITPTQIIDVGNPSDVEWPDTAYITSLYEVT